jgi:succinate dehydrogenase / fumarate reductase, cytochrome b subunit
MADVNRGNRPLSPHLTVYRRELGMMMSIMHRITGCGLAVGGVLLVWWFLAAARGPESFAFVDGLLTSWIGGLVLLLSMAALWYHFFNGIRHLVWDTGAGFALDQIEKSGIAVLIATAVMTVFTLIIALV